MAKKAFQISAIDGRESGIITVDVTQGKVRLYTQAQKDAFRAQADEYVKAAEADGVLALGGVWASLGGLDVPADIWAAYWTAMAIKDGEMAREYNNMVNDPPDSNFTQVAQPSFPAVTQIAPGGAITQADADALNGVSRLQGAEIGYLQAIRTALNWQSSADAAGDTLSAGLQVRTMAQFHASLDGLIATEASIRQSAFATWQALVGDSNLTVTPSQVRQFENVMANSGLPNSFASELAKVDDDPAAGDFITGILIVQDTNTVASGPAMVLARPALLTALGGLGTAVAGRATEQAAIADLQSLRTVTANKADARALDQAVTALRPTIGTTLWIDDWHLSKAGKRFFSADNAGVQKLLQLTRKKGGSLPGFRISSDVQQIGEAAQEVAAIAIPVSPGTTKKAAKQAVAASRFAAGFNALSTGAFKTAFSNLSKAWEGGRQV